MKNESRSSLIFLLSSITYPVASDEEERMPVAIASVVSGAKRVRLLLAGLPFGFRSPSHKDRVLGSWRELLALPMQEA